MQLKNIALYLFLSSLTLSCNNHENAQDRLNSVRSKTQQKIDSLESENNQRAEIYLFADSIINKTDFENSKKIIDSLINKFPNDNQFIIYKGDLYLQYGHYEIAIKEYSSAIANGYTPIAFEKRATAYIKTQQFPAAISDLKIAASYNSDYYYSIGHTFELMKKYDSALSYFKQYLNFSDDHNLKLHIDSLEHTLKHK